MNVGALAVLLSLISQNIGASFAKNLFPMVGPDGVSTLRIGLAACLLIAFRKPWKQGFPSANFKYLIFYGIALGVMNITIYHAFARLPIGIAVALEILGPLTVVLLSSRRKLDYLWLSFSVIGLVLLLPLSTESKLDPIGIMFALIAGVCWALYIVFGKQLSATKGSSMVAWGMLVAAILATPLGIIQAGSTLLKPEVLLIGLAVAGLSSALPYSLEMFAMRKLPKQVFGILLSTAPAIAALSAFAVLGEQLTTIQIIAIVLIMLSSGGSTLTAGSKS